VNATELTSELNSIQHSLIVQRSPEAAKRVFELYRLYHGEHYPRSERCMQCAQDCFYVLKYDIKHGTINAEKKITNTKRNMMTKFKLVKPFQLFGSPEYYTEKNMTDEIAEKLLNAEPKLSGFIVRLQPIEPVKVVVSEKPKPQPKTRIPRKKK